MQKYRKNNDHVHEEMRNLIAFWILGFINNVGYVIMIAGAQEISAGGVGIVYFCDIFPGFLMKVTGPYWFHLISYERRTWLGSIWMVVSFLMVAFGSKSRFLQLLGVCFSGLQSGMMEASYLAMTSYYKSRPCITSWSSGTGLAGIGGYAWVGLFRFVGKCSFQTTLIAATFLFPLLYMLTFIYVMDTTRLPSTTGRYYALPKDDYLISKRKSTMEEEHHVANTLGNLTFNEKLSFLPKLIPYMIPLIIVYFAEYTMQTGTWSAIGFPVEDRNARQKFYAAAGMMYQTGVFFSRSSGSLFQASYAVLFAMSVLQVMLLVFFSIIAITHAKFWYNWSLLLFCLLAGILGGGVYVNSFTLLSQQVDQYYVEFALSAASLGDTLGIIAADVIGVLLQGCIYSINRLPGASVSVSC